MELVKGLKVTDVLVRERQRMRHTRGRGRVRTEMRLQRRGLQLPEGARDRRPLPRASGGGTALPTPWSWPLASGLQTGGGFVLWSEPRVLDARTGGKRRARTGGWDRGLGGTWGPVAPSAQGGRCGRPGRVWTLTELPAVVSGDLRGGAVALGLIVLVEAADRHSQAVVGQHQEHPIQGSGKFF